MSTDIFEIEVGKVIDSCTNTRFSNIYFAMKRRSEKVLSVYSSHHIDKCNDIENIESELNEIYKAMVNNDYEKEEDLISCFDRPSYCFRKHTVFGDIWFHIIYDFTNGCFEIEGVYSED